MDLRDPNVLQVKSAELQNTATEIAVEFRQLLSFVESRNDNPQFDYALAKSSFDTVTSTLATKVDNLQQVAQPCDPALRERCAQLARILQGIADDVRNELAVFSSTHAQQGQFAARVPRNTAEAVGLIKSIIASAQAITSSPSPASPSSLSSVSSPALSAPQPARSASPAPTSPTSRALPPIPFSPPTLTPSPSSPATSIPKAIRPLSITRSASSSQMHPSHSHSSHVVAPIPVPSPTPLSHTPIKRDLASSGNHSPALSGHSAPSTVTPLSPSTPSPSPATVAPTSPTLQRSVSLPHHSLPHAHQPTLSNPPSSTPPRPLSPRRSSLGPRRSVSISVVPLTDGTTSVPSPGSSAMTLLIDKSKDPSLSKLVKSVSDSIAWINETSLKAKMLAFFVGSTLGKVPVGDFDVCRNCAQTFSQLREKFPVDPCPIGEFSYGYARHRTILYKYLADSVALPARIKTFSSSLRPPSDSSSPAKSVSSGSAAISLVEVYFDSKWWVVDLVKEIGELYEEDGQKASEYKSTSNIWEDEQPIKAAPPPSPQQKELPIQSESEPTPPEPSEPVPKPNGTGSEVPGSPLKASPKSAATRARSGTTSGLPNRTQRHSAYTPSSVTLPNPNTAGGAGFAKQAAKAPNGRVLRFPPENSEIILNERIGKGTFGDVYRCRIGGFTCAVKVVNIKSLSESALKMMHNEIYFLETLIHENIIGFLGHEEIPRREIKIFMEFMPLSLASIIQKRNSSAYHFHKKDIIKCAKGMGEALSYLHHRKIIHRDIKSSNVLLEIDTTLDRIQEVRLCDFGVSKATSESANAITFTGTNLWVAPEVFDVQFGIAANYDEKCDIWSFGMVLVEMVTLNPPYFGISTQQATQSIRNGIPPSLEVNPDIDPNLIYACLKKVPSERPSANEIISMLNQF